MSKQKWIRQEASRWLEESIITAEQYQQIVSRYPESHRINSLPVFGGILLGLGVLTFIASNWAGMPPFVKLLIIFSSLVLSYLAGDWFRKQAYSRLGVSFTLLGLFIYGAGFFLIGQMYHLSGNPLTVFYLWFIGAILVAWHYRCKASSLVSLLILIAAFVYGEQTIRTGWTLFFLYVLFAAGFIPLWSRNWSLTVASLLFLQIVVISDLLQWGEGATAQLGSLLFLTAAVLLPPSLTSYSRLLRVISYVSVTFISYILILADYTHSWMYNSADLIAIVASLGLLVLFAVVNWLRKQPDRLWDVLPFLPMLVSFFLPAWAEVQNFALLAALFVFTIALTLHGERRGDITLINTGTLLLGVTCFIAYVNFAWDFMDKSVFFFLSGALVLLLSLFLERKRRTMVETARGKNDE